VNGTRIEKTMYYYPVWIWLTAICLLPLGLVIAWILPASGWLDVLLAPLGLVVALIFYYLLRKRLAVSYSLCPHCAASRRAKRRLAGAAWLVFAALALLTVLALYERPGGIYFAIATIVSFFVALVASVVGSLSIRATGCSGKLLTLEGADGEFLATMAHTG